MALPLAVAAPLAIQGAGAIAQLIGASTMNPERPEYSNPSLNEMVRLSEQQANASMIPEMAAGKQMVDGNIASASQRLQSSVSSSGDLLNGISAIAQGGNRSLSDMIRHNMALKNQRRSQHLNVLSQKAQDDRYAFQQKQQEYFDKAQSQSALYSAGIQGLAGGLSDWSAIAQMQAGQPKEKESVSIPNAQPIGFQDMVRNGEQISWQNIVNSLNR